MSGSALFKRRRSLAEKFLAGHGAAVEMIPMVQGQHPYRVRPAEVTVTAERMAVHTSRRV
ncbi:MAG: hypothetical protein ACE145_17965 [Terriglobia bacterium]